MTDCFTNFLFTLLLSIHCRFCKYWWLCWTCRKIYGRNADIYSTLSSLLWSASERFVSRIPCHYGWGFSMDWSCVRNAVTINMVLVQWSGDYPKVFNNSRSVPRFTALTTNVNPQHSLENLVKFGCRILTIGLSSKIFVVQYFNI